MGGRLSNLLTPARLGSIEPSINISVAVVFSDANKFPTSLNSFSPNGVNSVTRKRPRPDRFWTFPFYTEKAFPSAEMTNRTETAHALRGKIDFLHYFINLSCRN